VTREQAENSRATLELVICLNTRLTVCENLGSVDRLNDVRAKYFPEALMPKTSISQGSQVT
jgi:hypothetical protein